MRNPQVIFLQISRQIYANYMQITKVFKLS